MFQAWTVGPDLAGVAHVGLHHHDGERAVGDVLAVLKDANLMLAHLAGDEGETCVGGRGRVRAGQ